MIFIYLTTGILAASIGAMPLGASNIIVINTTLKQNARQAFKIAITAGIAEVILSFYALHCNMMIQDFVTKHMWIQLIIIFILLFIGGFLFSKKQKKNSSKTKRMSPSKYLTGFLSGILNPPVLIYWLAVISFINKNILNLSLQSSMNLLFIFFIGVYIGKLLTLYAYSKFSLIIKNKVQNINLIINKVTGVLLISIALINALKLYLI